MRLLDGRGFTADPVRALALLREMCDQLWPASCAAAADVLAAGTVGAPDPAGAAALRKRACDGSPKYCPGAGSGSGSGSGSAPP
jgi:hypothetical protein